MCETLCFNVGDGRLCCTRCPDGWVLGGGVGVRSNWPVPVKTSFVCESCGAPVLYWPWVPSTGSLALILSGMLTGEQS